MNVTLVLVVALLVFERHVEAVFLYNRPEPKPEELESLGLKCIPGRTVIRVEEKRDAVQEPESENDYDEYEFRRTHMNAAAGDEFCQVCVCSIEGKDEYCSRRPARNVNECIRINMIKEDLERNRPFSHERSLSFRIRRDYIWHDDEIPYDPRAKCRRGRSYYSNSVNANDTDIDVDSDIDSLLDYPNKDICYYCVCSVGGDEVGCISRDPFFCEYFRILRYPDAARDRYRVLFQQDRPTYFRTLSFRLRRKMDEGIYDLMENVGNGLEDPKCIPFVSEYSDCSLANACTGCTRCTCDEHGKWECQRISECPRDDHTDIVDDATLESALDKLYTGLERKKSKRGPGSFIPPPPKPEEDLLLVPENKFDFEEEFRSFVTRQKRSLLKNHNSNATVKFYETIDEINQDTLKHLNSSGTIEAQKMNAGDVDKFSRRTDFESHNASDFNSLHIEYNQPQEFEHHAAENKVDSKHPLEDKINGLSHEEIHKILGNYSQNVKNSDLSKLVVNELIHGTEIIGDKNIKPLSNITFTPENDTLTAMAFIAGNLLNKLWDMGKDVSEASLNSEEVKHQKINDLLELFKEPLSLRQESFLKNALEKLTHVIDKNAKNVSLCANFDEIDIKPNNNNCTEKVNNNYEGKQSVVKDETKVKLEKQKKSTADALQKVNEVLSLIKKYEQIQNNLSNLKNSHYNFTVKQPSLTVKENLSADEKISLNLFGTILKTVTKLLSPNKMTHNAKSYNILRRDNMAKHRVEKLFNINLGNTTMTAKDKMILDFLGNIEEQPNCFFKNLQKSIVTPRPNLEGSILYNLSEFFKMKSFADLLKLVQDQPVTVPIHSTVQTTMTHYSVTTERIGKVSKDFKPSTTNKPLKLESAKEKLKNDLKAILRDLIELQREHGMITKSNINIADALPCIFNILNTESYVLKDNSQTVASGSVDNIRSFIDALKLDMKTTSQSRRNDANVISRPKSAIVWERAIKNLNTQYKQVSRRNSKQNPKSYNQLKEMIDKVDLTGSTYKNFAVQSRVAASEKLILLKTLQADVKQYINVLKTIKRYLETDNNISLDKKNELKEFVDNAAININLNKKVIEDLVTSKRQKDLLSNINSKASIKNEYKQSMRMPERGDLNENSEFKVRREQIMNQLIVNRLKLYIKRKEESVIDLNADIHYNIAKRILFHLENGNILLAKELFNVFMGNKQQQTVKGQSKFREYQRPSYNQKSEWRIPKLTFKDKDQELGQKEWELQDFFMKQLRNLRQLK